MYVLLDGDGAPARWPYTLADFAIDRADVELPDEITDAFLAGYNVYPLVAGDPPQPDELTTTQAVAPEFRDGEWHEAWITLDRPQPPVPLAVTPLQMRRALRASDLKAGIDAFLDQAGEEAQEAWEYATEIRRDDALVAMAAEALGKTSADLDALFRLAATMTA